MSENGLANQTLVELRKLAKELGIPSVTKYKKSELVDLINSKRTYQIDRGGVVLQEKRATTVDNTQKDSSSNVEVERQQSQGRTTTTQDTMQRNRGYQEGRTQSRNNLRNKEEYNSATGILEIIENNGYGFLRCGGYLSGAEDVYVSPSQIRRFNLSTGDEVTGKVREPNEGEKYRALIHIEAINGRNPEEVIGREPFERLIPIYPNQKLQLEHSNIDLAMRLIDIVSPIGKGQRGLIVAPPMAGKTTMLKKVARSITKNNPEVKLIVLLIDERPEEVTDMQRSIDGEVVYSTFDEEPSHHCKVAKIVLERAKRLVECGEDVVILMDSLTRLARAYNLTITPTGRTLSGGLDPGALIQPKKFFGAARNIENSGSLTILATALVETGSRMDDMIFEEFKGTGNMEVHLDRKLQERRIFPAIDIFKSGTRREELLLSTEEYEMSYNLRRTMANSTGTQVQAVTEKIINLLSKTKRNSEFLNVFSKYMEEHKK